MLFSRHRRSAGSTEMVVGLPWTYALSPIVVLSRKISPLHVVESGLKAATSLT